jgi:protoheme IX farnesyltransferase
MGGTFSMLSMTRSKFARYAWGLLAYNILVILWGALVRATRSGDGCGDHWPHCNGQLVPIDGAQAKTWIEYAHRISTVIDGFLILGLLIWAYKLYPKKHAVRQAAVATLFFTIIESLIGRALVKGGHVVDDASITRAYLLSLHLVNTMLLVGALALTAWWAMGRPRISWRGQGAMGFAIASNLFGLIALSVTGALAALGDTIWPAATRAELYAEIAKHGDPNANLHILQHLRSFHPYTSLGVGLWLLLICGLCGHLRPSPNTKQWMRATVSLFLLQMGLGLLNLFLLAPVWMQIVHLAVADAIWISLVFLSASALAVDCKRVEMEAVETQVLPDGTLVSPQSPQVLAAGPRATWKDYVALTKPRVISLLLFTTWTAMVIGAGGWPGLGIFLATGLGLYMAAGASNTINMVCERDLDLRMERTAQRPTLTTVPAPKALWFAFALAIGSFGLLTFAANVLAALMALSGLVVYVIVYTLLLKRRTWSNIVIGGAAGAFPPLVGYAAVTNSLSPLAWCLFALIFVWTPVHFWALALLIKDDYAKAGVPMLPVVRGDRYTVVQIGMYAIATVAISLFPFALRDQGIIGAGWLYGLAVVALNAILLWRSVQLYQNPSRPRASSLFHYSMLYLALLFLALAIDRAAIARRDVPVPAARSEMTFPKTFPSSSKYLVASNRKYLPAPLCPLYREV